MATLNIAMPDERKAFVEVRVSTGNIKAQVIICVTSSGMTAKKRSGFLVEGLESGTARLLDMAALRKRAQTLLKQEKPL